MPEEKEEPAMDMDFVIMMAGVAGGAAFFSTMIALLIRPIAMQLSQQLPLPQIPMMPIPGALTLPTM